MSAHNLDVSRETKEKLEEYVRLLAKWNKSINLVAPVSLNDVWSRHIEDSAQIMSFADSNWETWIDIGSGGGLPGLVIAILDEQHRPITLVESDTRKCSFLRTVKRELNLNVDVQNLRIEHFRGSAADILSARALAPLDQLLQFVPHLLKADGKALFLKGETHRDEIEVAQENWRFELTVHPSKTHPAAGILEIAGLKPRES
ncbi:16S rRNA (guanine(527)-N(7))-methyltransferase RsmG [Pseudooctadecabacter jejudonensis]|uniref:Ribosomal RNA small subunit methyltransferase G n=1 Tax=Pseudooctadecabacter jejudonensis TaxID=1391910 RepID=A0A1Y5S771_9RHOB|nr:16S rRNA (guanine(527)-N(7))-methyltransferase RsmG [Pseudooctadecabacter jejudonensis]SLN33504.1 Ribosomal RNA small subunit methyltransferase G [Pseudooctadecabacter jejudonensis]